MPKPSTNSRGTARRPGASGSLRTALYIRCSSYDQVKHGVSIPDQLARLRAETQKTGEQIVGEFIDQARSGTSAAKRKEYQQLLAAARRGEFDRVRVESVDRGHRNDLERRQFEAEMLELGIGVLYNGEPEKQAPQYRKFNRGIRGVVAELESDETSQRTYKRHRYRAQQGKWRGGPIPYGLKPDTTGWFEPDPETYPILLWMLERRAVGQGYHAIAKQLNQGIALPIGQPLEVPPTPGLIIYRRKPYLERQDPETGDIIREPRAMPSGAWSDSTVEKICKRVFDGVYAGVLRWGERWNKFDEDADGNPKEAVRVETGKPLIPEALLHRVQAVELAAQEGEAATMSAFNSYLLSSLRCGACGKPINGYTSTKYKGEKKYRYRKYRCSGRVNRPGSCQMPMLSADVLERLVLDVALKSTYERSQDALLEEINEAIARKRTELTSAISVATERLRERAERRKSALDALTRQYQGVSERTRAVLAEQADQAVAAYDEVEEQIRTLQIGLQVLDEKARTITVILTDPLLDSSRWQEPEAYHALKRALKLLVHQLILREKAPGEFHVEVQLYEIRQSLLHESAWGSNPPARLVTAPTGFEDHDGHRATSALGVDCRG